MAINGGSSRQVQSTVKVLDELAGAIDILTLVLISDATAVLSGRFLDAAGHPLAWTNHTTGVLGTVSKWQITVGTTARTLPKFFELANIDVPLAAKGIRFNMSNTGKLIWNCAGLGTQGVDTDNESNANLIDPALTDGAPDATYDGVVAAGSLGVMFGRVRSS